MSVLSTQPVLSVRGVTKAYRRGRETVHALRGVDLEVAPGEVVVLLGRSGSGKTTLLNCVAGWEAPDSGAVEVLSTTGTPWQQVAVVPQRFGLLDELTLAENVALPARLAGSPEPEAAARELLEELGLAVVLDRLPAEVSLGEAQRAALARALVVRPTLLLADEPTGRLDEALSVKVAALVRRRCHEQGSAALLASHDALTAASADRVVRLHDGQLREESPAT
ncbi:putative ABC transport system ATP-binding protein [Motilibacter peucedani]|uniref:Putative ABC transport system ATP-binding protein n=1 Tax=Motilibacter peucedani TaxID=598650 RepID=A0A420XPL9_9ACTN|nr:ATP-binding cassette domain-containing protein [Motilibacter peucedani]RKS74125.1 putative ABC transport system ATP-binding protein [Motilibacter peucedani]